MRRSCIIVTVVLLVAGFPAKPGALADEPPLASPGTPLHTTGSAPPPITYSLDGDNRRALVTLDPSSGKTMTLRAGLPGYLPWSWSARTHQIAYGEYSSQPPNADTYRIPDSGGTPTQDSTTHDLMWLDISRDGATYVYSDTPPGQSTAQVYLRAASGGTPRQLTGAGGLMPRLSPDGRHVSFIRKIGAHMEVCTIGTEGKDLHRITYTTGDSTSSMTGSFSPDGRRLLYSTYPGPPAWQTWVADLDGSHKRLVTHNGEQAEWADNGWLVYFTIASTGLRQVTVRSPGIPGKATVLTHNAYNSEHLRIRH